MNLFILLVMSSSVPAPILLKWVQIKLNNCAPSLEAAISLQLTQVIAGSFLINLKTKPNHSKHSTNFEINHHERGNLREVSAKTQQITE